MIEVDLPEEEITILPQEEGGADGGRGDSATTEGVLTSMWRKITNFFTSAEGSTSFPGSENYTARYTEVNDRPARMVRPETRRGNVHHDYRRREAYRRDVQADEGGIPAPFDNNGRPLKSFKSKRAMSEKSGSSNEVRIIHREKRSPFISLKYRTSNYESVSKFGKDGTPITQTFTEPQPIVEEFDQGEAADTGRQKRFTDILNKQWVTEKIIEGSDPVENIDDENYIEEINEDPFLLKEPSLEPIIVEDQTSEVESTFTTIQELQEIQIID
ncbi:hypothetical protein CDAR_608471 [Caerostris darwini]|uniref:Uncharacterized protein n=1 Tax=Caerostris darwini TaxID=1538125 RepID=A0AAV4WIZ6_9ARAC|nr:hypothetical protein CDAR_608471 [Caerostris darwini]